MLNSGQVLEVVDGAASDELDLPDISQLISSTQSQSRTTDDADNAMNEADDGLSHDSDYPPSVPDDETLNQTPVSQGDNPSEGQTSTTSSKKSPSKSSHHASKGQRQSAPRIKPASRVKIEDIPPPLPASSQYNTSSPSKATVPPASSEKTAKAGSKKPKSGTSSTPDQSAGAVKPSSSKGASKKRKRLDQEEPEPIKTQAKVQRLAEGGAGPSRATNEKDGASSDVEEIAPYTSKPKPKVRQVPCSIVHH